MADPNKKYGLFLPKNKKSAVKTTNVFDDDSDDDLPGMALVNATINKEAQKSKVKRQTQLAIDQAMAQDPNIYEYDKIYDAMSNTKAETEEAAKAKKDSKPKYIANLMKAAEKRKLEQEKVQEKKIQKERETEGGEFEDKEVFVTGKYKEKLEEMEKEAERERREAAMEELLDVKKQKDMSGFYRYLLNEKTGESIHNGEHSDTKVKTEAAEPGESSDTRVKTEPGEAEVDTSRVKTEASDKSATTSRVKRSSSSDSSGDSSDSEPPETRDAKSSKGRNLKSRSPDRRKRSRSPDRRKKSRSRDRRRSRSPHISHREKDKSRSNDSDSKHRHSRRSRSNDRHKHLHKDKKHRSSSRDRISKSSKRSRSSDRKTKSKDKKPRSNDRSTKHSEEKVVLLEKNAEEASRETGSSEIVTKDSGQSEIVTKDSGQSEIVTKDSEGKSKYARHTTEKTLSDAKARYLARQIAKEKARLPVDTTGAN